MLIYLITLVQFYLERPNWAVRRTWVRDVSLGASHALTVRGWAPALTILGVPFYLYIHPLTQNYQI